jgi:hypothetical protein
MNSIRRHVMNNHRDATIICSAGGPKHLKIDADQWLPALMFQCGSACATVVDGLRAMAAGVWPSLT